LLPSPTLGELLQRFPIRFYQGLLLRSAPAFELSFRRDGIRDLCKVFRPYKFNRASRPSVSLIDAILVFRDAVRQVIARRAADVK
jgi:hypothetical protein